LTSAGEISAAQELASGVVPRSEKGRSDQRHAGAASVALLG